MRRQRGGRVEHQAQRHLAGVAPAGALGQQRMQQAGGVAVAAGTGVVLGVGNEHRPRRMLGLTQGLADGGLGRQDVQPPLRRLSHLAVKLRHRLLAGLCVLAMAPDHRRTFVKISGRKAHAEAQHRAVLVAQG